MKGAETVTMETKETEGGLDVRNVRIVFLILEFLRIQHVRFYSLDRIHLFQQKKNKQKLLYNILYISFYILTLYSIFYYLYILL